MADGGVQVYPQGVPPDIGAQGKLFRTLALGLVPGIINAAPTLLYYFSSGSMRAGRTLMFFNSVAIPVPGSIPILAFLLNDNDRVQFSPPGIPFPFSVGITVAVSTTQHVFTAGAAPLEHDLYLMYQS